MGQDSKIQWTDHTFNPWRGCTKVADGCQNCYADAQSKRNPGTLGIWGPNGTRVVAAEPYWREPLKWNSAAKAAGVRPRVFCASLADVFEEWKGSISSHHGHQLFTCYCGSYRKMNGSCPSCGKIPHGGALTMNGIRQRLFALIDATPNLDWLLVTKRPENILRMWPCPNDTNGDGDCQQCAKRPTFHRRDNVWLLTSISDQQTAETNIPELLKCRDLAPVLGVSYEPALGPVDFNRIYVGNPQMNVDAMSKLDWIIVGGESGHNARPFNLEWARQTVQQCGNAGVACFVKQLGSHAFDGRHIEIVGPSGKVHYTRPAGDPMEEEAMKTPGYSVRPMRISLKDKKGGDMKEWPQIDLRVREFPQPAAVCG